MCKNAASTVASLMGAIEPTLVNLLTVLNIADTPQGEAAISAFNAALQALQNWKPGTSAEDVIQLINAFTDVFNALPIPADAKGLADIISAGIVVIISVLTGNSPAAVDAAAQARVMDEAHAKVAAMVPTFKESNFDKARAVLGDHTVATKEYKNHWNKAVAAAAKVQPKYAVLKQA